LAGVLAGSATSGCLTRRAPPWHAGGAGRAGLVATLKCQPPMPTPPAPMIWAVLILAAFTVTSGLIGGSFLCRPSVTWGHERGIYSLQLDRGALIFFDYTRPGLARQPLTWRVLDAGRGTREGRWVLGFVYRAATPNDPIFFAGVPLWVLVIPLAFASGVLARRARRARRALRGQCVRCGYDLRATPGRCPECGASVTAPRRAAGIADAADGTPTR